MDTNSSSSSSSSSSITSVRVILRVTRMASCWVLLLGMMLDHRSNSFVQALSAVQYRNGKKSDELAIAATMTRELMNPLGIQGERFVIAEEATDSFFRPSRRVGWGQIRPLGATDTDSSQQAQLWELSSIYVDPKHRGQGIGTEIVKQLLQRYLSEHEGEESPLSNLYLLTLVTTIKWYKDSFGCFEVVPDEQVPPQLAFEVSAGKLVTKVIGAELCCMRGVDDKDK